MLALSSLTLSSSPISLLLPLPPLPSGSHCSTTTSSSKDPSCCFPSSNGCRHVCSCCHHSSLRHYDDSDAHPRWSNNMNPQYCKKKEKKRNVMHPMAAASALPPKESNPKVLKIAREKFTQEISFRSRDTDVSLAKALLLVAVEDEAFMAFNREMDTHSILNERKGSSLPFRSHSEFDDVEGISLAGKSMSGWLDELDTITKEVEAELVTRDIGCHLVEIIEAVNVVLFELRGFKRFPVLLHSKFSYLHTVLDSGCGSAIMLSIIYIEICHRLGVSIMGSRVGEDFLIWPQTENLKEIFKASSGHSWFSVVNGGCVKDPRSKAFELTSSSLLGLDIATNRDIIGIVLANLIRLHWKRASRMNHGLMLTTPLRPIDSGGSKVPLLRPLELRLALMASERLLLLQPHNWTLRRDHGMLLYYSRRYAEAVQELSICMAFAPVEEAEVMEPFVEKLHLLRLESSWKSLDQAGTLAVP